MHPELDGRTVDIVHSLILLTVVNKFAKSFPMLTSFTKEEFSDALHELFGDGFEGRLIA